MFSTETFRSDEMSRVTVDGEALIDWLLVERMAARYDSGGGLAGGEATLWAVAKLLLAVRDGTWRAFGD